VYPSESGVVEDLLGARDCHVGEHRFLARDACTLAVFLSIFGSRKSGAIRTRSHPLPLALCAVETTSWERSSATQASTAAITSAAP